jgi:hypothetical protein
MTDLLFPLASTAAQFLIGGALEKLSFFLEPHLDFRQRVTLRKTCLLEEQGKCHRDFLLECLRQFDAEANLGDGFIYAPASADQDGFGKYAKESMRRTTVHARLDLISRKARFGHNWIFRLALLGIFGAMASWLIEETRAFIFYGSLATILVQVILACLIRSATQQLNEYEETT